MQPSNEQVPSERLVGGHKNATKGTADDYIELLVGRMADDAGAHHAAAVSANQVTEVERHLEELRFSNSVSLQDCGFDSSADGKSQIVAVEDSPEVPEPEGTRVAPMHRVALNSSLQSVGHIDSKGPSTISAIAQTIIDEPTALLTTQPLSGVEAVILEAVRATKNEPPLLVESRSSGADDKVLRRGRSRKFPYFALLILLLIAGAISATNKAFVGNVTALLASYWVPEASDFDGTLQSSQAAPLKSKERAPTLDTAVVSAEPNKRRTVKTYRVAADGTIVFGPRIVP